MRLLFVCTGNICRSPTAERLAEAYGKRYHVNDWTAESAGTHAVISHPIHANAALVLEQLGGSTANFAARQLTTRIASAADLILTMTRAHRDAVLELAPGKFSRTFTLAEAAHLATNCGPVTLADFSSLRASAAVLGDELDIPDPIRGGSELFAAVGAQIADLLPSVLDTCMRSTDQDSANQDGGVLGRHHLPNAPESY
ncbi:low molecular weight phosphatase family protein [Mycolicibacterium austroafricanum]|nr:low molecular weight phosphatase family protein [Mycolicibacterium austroafricanum]